MSEAMNAAPAQGSAPSSEPVSQSTSGTLPKAGESNPHSPANLLKSSQPSSQEIYEVKVDGKIVKMSRQEVLDNASMAKHASSKFEEAKQTKNKVDRIINQAKNNPIEALMDPELGLSKDQIKQAFEAWYYKEFVETEDMSDDQKKIREYETKLKKFEEAEAQKKKHDEDQQQEALTSKQREYLEGQIVEAMEASGFPRTPFFAQRMAFYMRQNLINGWDAPLDLIVRQVKDEHKMLMGNMSKEATAEQLITMLGEDVINKIRQHDLKTLREKRRVVPPSKSYSNGQLNNPNEKLSSADVNRRLNAMRRGEF